jgi:hypothetical protein
VTSWIFALAAAASSTPTPPPARVQAIGTATVTIIDLERIDFSDHNRFRKDRPVRQIRTQKGEISFDYY